MAWRPFGNAGKLGLRDGAHQRMNQLLYGTSCNV
jgi:hypothetical protein